MHTTALSWWILNSLNEAIIATDAGGRITVSNVSEEIY